MLEIASRAKEIIANEGIISLVRKTIRKSKELLTGRYELNSAYDNEFFDFNLADSRPQAEWLAPKIAKAFGVRNMVDIGCATGHWVDAFLRAGVNARGVEGSESARNSLVCPVDKVTFADLRYPLTDDTRQVDLVISLEVAEHIEEKYADIFLSNIVRYSPETVLLTAARPGQGGHHHVNERPHEYWIEKMAALGYVLDSSKATIISGYIKEGQELKDVTDILRHPGEKHTGVWFPEWILHNLMVFSRRA